VADSKGFGAAPRLARPKHLNTVPGAPRVLFAVFAAFVSFLLGGAWDTGATPGALQKPCQTRAQVVCRAHE